jgi:4a-hydroxytetrahydrobiopterin dehydratase
MTHGRTLARILVLASILAGSLVAASSPAQADFHLMKVQEVYAGSGTDPSADFVELRMDSAGQNRVGGHVLYLFGAPDVYGGSPRHECTIPANVPNAALDDRILFATSQFTATAPDFTIPPLLDGSGGAVCFENIDCVSWGSFSGQTTNQAGTPLPGGISAGQSINRTGDTNNSASDFTPGSPTAEANGGGNLGTMTCGGAPGPGGGPGPGTGTSLKGLKTSLRGGRAIIRGQIDPPYPGKRVSLTFFANGSPLRKVAKANATLNPQSRFKKGFRVPAASTRCKVKVTFEGAPMAQKKFGCWGDLTGKPEALPDEEIDRRLVSLTGWKREAGEIFKWFRFAGFPEAIDFLRRIVEPAERMNHHPDIESHYDRVRIGLHTWSANAITEKDLALAEEIEGLAET